nr:MAG TPA: hypothetical protein [Caudoviricetes sp.]
MLTNAQESAHNARVRLNYRTGIGVPNEYTAHDAALRSDVRADFLCIAVFLDGQTVWGTLACAGSVYPVRQPVQSAHPDWRRREQVQNLLHGGHAMQAFQSAAQTQPSTFNLPFAITALLKNQLTSGEAKDYAIMSCSEAKNILIAAADSAESDSQMLSTAGLLSVIKSAASILECAELLVNETEK